MEKIDFNEGWIYYPINNEAQSQAVCIPHDAMLSERRSNLNAGGKNSAWFAGNDYVYEKDFVLPEELKNKRIVFEFEGVYKDTEVYINGSKAAYRPYGYTNFYVEADEYLKKGSQNNIKVIAKNSDQPNCRWYSGAGIYRPVWLYALPEKHILLNGIKIKTLSHNPAKIEVSVKTNHPGLPPRIEILDGETCAAAAVNKTDGGGSVKIDIENAKLWSPESPFLYKAVVDFEGDRQEIMFGIRKIECGSKSGFMINGERVILRGACIHHDNGLLGAACFPDAEQRKIGLMKQSGYNAVRSAHNPCSKAMLEACDRLGMLVLDEYADMWYTRKTKYDYAGHMTDWWRQDLSDMVDKDYNHPSVIMYSTGNEVSETAEPRGIRLAGEMTEYLHRLDETRPVTCGINIFFNYLSSLGLGIHSNKKAEKTPKKAKKEKAVGSEFFNNLAGLFGDKFMKFGASLRDGDRKTKDAFANMDIAGYNYGIYRYKKDLKKYPDRVILGSETFCADAYRFWELAKKHPALIGDFVWAGTDYIGEVGIGAWVYRDHAPDFKGGAGWLTAGSGRVDITGAASCETLYTKVAFEQEKIRLGVIPVNNAGKPRSPSAWKFSNALESWSWEGFEGNKTAVEVYARAFRVDLYINSKKAGTKKPKNNCICRFKTRYQSGRLLAISYDRNGEEIARASLSTAGKETGLRLTPETNAVQQNGLCYVRLEYTDPDGILKPALRGKIKVTVQNGTLLGLGHACPYNPDGYLNDITDTYFGSALAVIKPDSKKAVKIIAASPFGNAEAEIPVS